MSSLITLICEECGRPFQDYAGFPGHPLPDQCPECMAELIESLDEEPAICRRCGAIFPGAGDDDDRCADCADDEEKRS